MFLSKKEYQDLWEMIEKQNQQIEDLIKIAIVASLYFDLVDKVKEFFPEISPELEQLLNDSRESFKRGEGD